MKDASETLLSFDQAEKVIFPEASAFRMSAEGVPLDSLLGRVLAADLKAPSDQPAADNSAMDGYAVRHADVAAASAENPVSLLVAGEALAGHPCERLPDGHAVYITTGGLIPPGADTVVKIEDVTVSADRRQMSVVSAPPLGTYIRRQGKDMRAGQVVLEAGSRLEPFLVGIVASLGHCAVSVTRRPRVAVLTSGDEVVMPFEIPEPWQVRNANAPTLSAQIHEAGGIPLDLGIVRDRTARAVEMLLEAASQADLVVTCGGVSMGEKDPFIAAFKQLGVKTLVHGVAMKPGKPLFFGLLNGKPLFGLPGNQASCAVTCELFVRPFLRRMLGDRRPDRTRLWLPLSTGMANRTGRDHFMRGRISGTPEGTVAEVLAHQDSHLLSSLIGIDLLVRHPGTMPQLAAGERLECRLIGG